MTVSVLRQPSIGPTPTYISPHPLKARPCSCTFWKTSRYGLVLSSLTRVPPCFIAWREPLQSTDIPQISTVQIGNYPTITVTLVEALARYLPLSSLVHRSSSIRGIPSHSQGTQFYCPSRFTLQGMHIIWSATRRVLCSSPPGGMDANFVPHAPGLYPQASSSASSSHRRSADQTF